MNQNSTIEKISNHTRHTSPTRPTSHEPAGTFPMRVDKTTYIVGVHFSQDSKDTLEDKLKRLMREDVKAGNF